MRKILVVLFALFVGVSLTFAQAAADKPAKAEKKKSEQLDRISGVVQSMSKENSTISVKDHKTGVIRQITYSDATKFTKVNKPGASVDEIKEGTRVIALGKFDDKQRLAASRIDIRLPK